MVQREFPAGEARQPVAQKLPLRVGGRARREAGRRDRAGVDHRVRRAGGRSFDGATELKGSPVLLTPSFSRAASSPIAWQTSANTNGFDTLWIENSNSESPAEWTAPDVPTTHTPNNSRGTVAKRRDVVSHLSLVARPKSKMGLRDQARSRASTAGSRPVDTV